MNELEQMNPPTQQFHLHRPPNVLQWCTSHLRIATHTNKEGHACCDPTLGGIMLPCHTVHYVPAEALHVLINTLETQIAEARHERRIKTMLRKYLRAALDETGEVRSAILEQGVDFADLDVSPTDDELRNPNHCCMKTPTHYTIGISDGQQAQVVRLPIFKGGPSMDDIKRGIHSVYRAELSWTRDTVCQPSPTPSSPTTAPASSAVDQPLQDQLRAALGPELVSRLQRQEGCLSEAWLKCPKDREILWWVRTLYTTVLALVTPTAGTSSSAPTPKPNAEASTPQP